MARDISILPARKQPTYEQIKASLGEAEADKFFDNYVKDMGISVPQVAPQVSAIPEQLDLTGLSVAPPVEPAIQPVVQPVVEEPAFKPPTPTELTARLGVGEFAPKPTEADIASEEFKALEAQTAQFVKQGIPTKQDVILQITGDLQTEGLGVLDPQFNKRLEEELAKSDYAEKRAMEVVAPARMPRTAEFVPSAPVATPQTIAKAPGQVEEMGGFEAIGRAFLPQEMESPAETKAREQTEQNRIELDRNAAELAATKGISQEEAKKEILRQVQKDFRQDAVDEIGFTSTPSDYDSLARQRYLDFLKTSLPDEYAYEIRRDEEEAAFGIAGSATSGRAQFEELAKQGAGAALSFLASDKYDPQVYKDVKNKLGITPKTEAVVESLPLTIVRDLAGISRFVFNPLLDAAMYDVVPGTDTKINPDDFGLIPRERTGRKEEEAWGKSYIAKPSDNPFEDQLREIAVEVATARSLGDDLAAQSAVRPEDESKYRAVGILSEVALPINIFSVPGKVAGISARAGRAGAKALKLSEIVPGSVAEMFSDVAKVGEALETPLQIPIGLYNTVVADNTLWRPLADAAKKAGVNTADELRRSTKLTDALIDSNRISTIEASHAGDRYTVLGILAKGPDDLLTNPLYKEIVTKLDDLSPEIMTAMKSGQVQPKVLANAVLKEVAKSNNAIVRDANRIIDATIKEGLGIPQGAVSINQAQTLNILDAPRRALKTSLQESLSNTILGEWTFLTPSVVVSTKLAKSPSPVKGKNVVQFVADDIASNMKNYVDVAEVGQEATFKLNQSINVKNLLKQSLVYSPNERLRYYENLFKGLSVGDTMSPEQYKALHTLVSESRIGTLTRELKLGAFKAEGTGRAYTSATEPEVLRSSILQYGKQIGQEGQKLIDKIAKTSFARAPVKRYVADMISGYAGALESFPAQFSQTISALGKQGFKADEIYGQVLNKAVNQPQGVATVSEVITPLTNGQATAALKDVMRAQFNYTTKTPQGKAIDKMVNEYAKVSFVDPNTNASLFLSRAREIRDDIIRRFPEIKDQEVIAQGTYGARTVRTDSLPDTILSLATNKTQEKVLADILSKNRNAIYDNSALAKFDVANKDFPKRDIIKAIDSGLVARLNGYSSSDDILGAMKEAGISDDIIRTNGDTLVSTVNDYYIDILRGTHGFESASGSEILRRLNLQLQEIEPGVLAYLPVQMSKDIQVIRESLRTLGRDPIRSGKLIDTIGTIERQSPGFMSRIWGDIGTFAGYVHKNIAEGMLAGKVIPNVTYLSENVFTAPLIAAVTNPKYVDAVIKNVPKMAGKTATGLVGGEFGRFGGYTSDLYQPALSYPNKVAIVTPSGEQITNAELWRLFTQARVGAGQAETVLRPQSIAQLKQLSQLVGADNKLMTDAARRFKDFAPSGTASIPMTVAQNTDMAFRQALFKEALRRGATAEEAATIARETLLDYGLLDRILPDQLKSLKAPFMFLSFSASMSAAILKGLTKGESAENILRLARYHRDMAKYSGVYAPGQSELESLFVEQQQTIGEKPATYAYLRDPVMGQIFWAANIAENFSYFLSGGESLGGTLESLMNETAYTPYTGFILDIVEAYKGSMVSPRQIAFAQSTGLWPSMQSNFEIEEMPIEKMRRGEPTFQGKQYRFKTEAGKKKYITFMFGLTVAGHNRTLNDYTNMMVAAGMAPEGAYLARYYPENTAFEGVQADPSLKGFVNGALYMIVRQRAVKPPTQIQVYDKQIQTELRKLKDLQGTNVEK